LDLFLDIHEASLNKRNETLCGDQVRVLRGEDKTIVVLSDGLGSGVKANILATLTSSILITMLGKNVPLEEVIKTVIGTLPTCKVRNIAYATFTIIQVDHRDNSFEVFNFDNPPVFHVRRGHIQMPHQTVVEMQGRRVTTVQGTLELGDFLGAVSDGVLYAGMGVAMNFGWGWSSIAKHLEAGFRTKYRSAREIVTDVIGETNTLYRGEIGDDATFVGLYVREEKALILFTGPPLDKEKDESFAKRVLDFPGVKVVCGGTTSNIVASYVGQVIETDLGSLRPDVPPIGRLDGIDLMTEGILTMSRAMDLLRECEGNVGMLPRDRNGAVMLASELLRADHIFFLVGQQINEFYQNPLLPRSISIRKHLIQEMADFLLAQRKEVTVEYC
jgi:hypothetical protein